MKKLYQFTINTTKTVEVPTEKEIEGKKVKIIEKVEQVEPKTYFIRRPNRSDYDEAELCYAIKFSEDVRRGILTRSEILKRFANEDVVIKKVYEDYTAKENELQRISLSEKTEENVEKQKRIENEILNILIEIQNFEFNKSSVFEQTAENRARNKTVFWWILNLAYKDEAGKEVPLFEGSNLQEKIVAHDKLIESENKHFNEVIQNIQSLTTSFSNSSSGGTTSLD